MMKLVNIGLLRCPDANLEGSSPSNRKGEILMLVIRAKL